MNICIKYKNGNVEYDYGVEKLNILDFFIIWLIANRVKINGVGGVSLIFS